MEAHVEREFCQNRCARIAAATHLLRTGSLKLMIRKSSGRKHKCHSTKTFWADKDFITSTKLPQVAD